MGATKPLAEGPAEPRPVSNTGRAAAELRRMIFSGEMAAGSDHLESELAARLGMSRTPVREATLMLQEQGLLQVRPRKGVRIRPVSPDDMREIYEVLTEMESLAAERAARARPGAAALAALGEAIAEMERALDRGDREAWAEADDRFHAELVRLGGNSRVSGIVARMADQVRRARSVTLHMRPLPVQSNTDHRRVLEAIRAGDAGAARRLHRAHRTAAGEMLVALLERHRLRQL
ncbi:FCD domain-containing protein [Rhodobacteraceae bacterium 2CG4]|uniref:FCD domain-containing protein n=1 Tax=Halovulum marinum TaxID=2662447 RepID=A0A6L5YX08_9RHOB|nr:GntR family transcriptional regulator [Halovulum marinum]MSU88876.1 FCD domain-containing protein [Halovulum marinum]